MDNLERYIRENRDKLDIYEPLPGTWEKIERKRNIRKRTLLISFAAAAMITIVLGGAMVLYSSSQREKNLSGIYSEVNEMEHFYNSLASTLYSRAKPMLTDQPEIEKELDNDLEKIDRICEEIKKDLRDNAANKEVIEALIRNYTIKIHILEDMLKILNENEDNTQKKESHEL